LDAHKEDHRIGVRGASDGHGISATGSSSIWIGHVDLHARLRRRALLFGASDGDSPKDETTATSR